MLNVRVVAKTAIPRIPFKEIAGAILGSSYELSLAFVGDTRMQALNKAHRGKDKPTNVLSFPYDEQDGEIIIDARLVKKEAQAQGRAYRDYMSYLFIHGCLHLKGYDHGHIMEDKETQYMRQFNLKE
ncbi:MAG: rRNA maturation RNase YbeY [bacterium]|nr:rRNA maturation RNase YbeY [bacterium]